MWIIYTFVSTVALAIRNLTGKAGVEAQNPYIVAWATFFFSLPISIVAVVLFGFEIKDISFWYILPIRILMDVVALITILHAFKYKSVSFVVPLLSLTPILTVFMAFILRGEKISPLGILGILIIALSCLVTYFSEYRLTKLGNRDELIKATGLVLITAVLYSILDPVHPLLIERSNPYTYFFISTIIFVIIFTIIVYIKSKDSFRQLFSNKKLLIVNSAVGFSLGFEVLALFLALSAAPAVAFVSSLRTSNIAITAAGGFLLFKEKFNMTKILGIIGCIVGILVIGLG